MTVHYFMRFYEEELFHTDYGECGRQEEEVQWKCNRINCDNLFDKKQTFE